MDRRWPPIYCHYMRNDGEAGISSAIRIENVTGANRELLGIGE